MDLPEDIDIEDFEDDEPGELYQMLGMVILPLCSEMHGQWQTGLEKLVTVTLQNFENMWQASDVKNSVITVRPSLVVPVI